MTFPNKETTKPKGYTAKQLLDAVKRTHPMAAIIPELTFTDPFSPTETERRIDALMFLSLQRTAIEIKISRSDASRETSEKIYAWSKVTDRFVYVTPPGLLDGLMNIHPHTGIWELDPATGLLVVKRKAKTNKHPEPLPQNVIQRIAYRADKR